jgi:hypothetical protein
MTVPAAAPAGTAGEAAIARALLDPLLVAGRRRAVRLAATAGLHSGEELAEGLARHLVDRVTFATAALTCPSALTPVPAGARVGEFRQALLREYPVLRRVLGAVWSGWSAFAADFTVRLAGDLGEIRGSLLRDTSAQPAWCTPGAGDIHQGGSVTIVGFSGGGRAVYRPRDSSHLAAWGAVLGQLAAADPAVRLRSSRVLQRAGYAWAEFVGAEPPRSRAEREGLCRRVGMTARLLDVLGACDISEQNLIVARDQVVLVDTETIVAPGMRGPGHAAPRGAPAALDEATPRVGEPVFRAAAATGFLSLPMTMDTRAILRNIALPARADYAFIAANARLVLDGYAAMHRALVGVLRRDGGPASILRPVEQARARFLARSTQVYWIVLRSALQPEGLRDEREFERRLGRLGRAAKAAPEAARGAVERLVGAEVSALRVLDIPYFEIAAASTDVAIPGATRLPGYAGDSPCARAASRLMALGAAPAPAELDTVRALLAAAAPDGIVGTPLRAVPARGAATGGMKAGPPLGSPAGPHGRRPPDWAGLAAGVAAVLANLVSADEGALVFRPHNGVVGLERLGPDLLSGYAGLAVVLADAAALLGDRALADQARVLATRAEGALRRALPGIPAARPREVLDPGAYRGLGALIYALARVEAALGQPGSPSWRDEVAAALGDGDAIESAATRHGWDLSIATGTAGLVLALDAAALARGLARWWPGFVTRTPRPATGSVAGSHPIAEWFFPSVAAGARFATARLGATGCPDPWPSAPGQAARAADRLLSRVVTADAGGLAATAGALAEAPDSWTSLAALGEIEAGLAANGPAAAAGELLAGRAGGLLVTRHAQTGTWFPEAVAPDRYRLSALWGLGAVCHAFTRLAAPAPIPSIRLVAPCAPGLAELRTQQRRR